MMSARASSQNTRRWGEKPAFTPWQVKVSEALRDGDAAAAIQAWHERGRLHLGYNEERTLTALVADWDRYTRQHPERAPSCWRAPTPRCGRCRT